MGEHSSPCDWTKLLEEILITVAEHVPSHKDKMAMLFVCHAWRKNVLRSVLAVSMPPPPLALPQSDIQDLRRMLCDDEEHIQSLGLPTPFPIVVPFLQSEDAATEVWGPICGLHPSSSNPLKLLPAAPASAQRVAAAVKLFPSLNSLHVAYSIYCNCRSSSFVLSPDVLHSLARAPLQPLSFAPSPAWTESRFCTDCRTARERTGHAFIPPPNSCFATLSSAFGSFLVSSSRLKELKLCLMSKNWIALQATFAAALCSLTALEHLFVGPDVFQPHSLRPYTALRNLKSLAVPLLSNKSSERLLPCLAASLRDLTIFPVCFSFGNEPRYPQEVGMEEEDWAEGLCDLNPIIQGCDWILPPSIQALEGLTALALGLAPHGISLRAESFWKGQWPELWEVPSLAGLSCLQMLHLGGMLFYDRMCYPKRGLMVLPESTFRLPASLTELIFSSANENDAIRCNVDVIARLGALRSLTLIGANLSSPSLRMSSLQLTRLCICGMKEGEESQGELQALASLPTLKSLHLDSWGLEDLLTFTEAHSSLTSLAVDNCEFPKFEGAEHLACLHQLRVSWRWPSRVWPIPMAVRSLSLRCLATSLPGLEAARDSFRQVTRLSLVLEEENRVCPATSLTSFLGSLSCLTALSIALADPLSWSSRFVVSVPALPRLQDLACACHGVELQSASLPSLRLASLTFYPASRDGVMSFDYGLEALFEMPSLRWLCLANAQLTRLPDIPPGLKLSFVRGEAP